jgi:hypothetical protein
VRGRARSYFASNQTPQENHPLSPPNEPLHWRAQRDPKAITLTFQILSTEGRVVGPYWEKLKPSGPKVEDRCEAAHHTGPFRVYRSWRCVGWDRTSANIADSDHQGVEVRRRARGMYRRGSKGCLEFQNSRCVNFTEVNPS